MMNTNKIMPNEQAQDDELSRLFPSVAAQLRIMMSNMYMSSRRLASSAERIRSPERDADSALLDQSYYQMLRIAHNLSASAALTAHTPLRLRAGDIVDTVRQICDGSMEAARELGLMLSFSTARERHICLFQREGIEEVLYQLLSNAFKFTPSGGSVTVGLRWEKGNILLSVKDTGCGIATELRPILFDRYLHPERMDPPPHGLGLGLSLCRNIAQGHQGTLQAESKAGAGSVFTLSIPDRQPDGPTIILRDSYTSPVGGFDPFLVAFADSLPTKAFLLRKDHAARDDETVCPT